MAYVTSLSSRVDTALLQPVRRSRLFWDARALDKETARLAGRVRLAIRERLLLDLTTDAGAILMSLTDDLALHPLTIANPAIVTTYHEGIQRRGLGMAFEHRVPVSVSGSTVLWKLLPERGFVFPIEGRLNSTGSTIEFRRHFTHTDGARCLEAMDEACTLVRTASDLQAGQIADYNAALPALLEELIDCQLEQQRKLILMRLRSAAA